jgi:hypothetical protein
MRHSNFIFLLLVFFCASSIPALAQDTDMWEPAMLEFERLDRENVYPPNSILFTGSSSIVLWRTLAQDMAPFPVIQRGFGGSKMPDVLKHADRYIKKHQFSAVVVFVANDITGDPNNSDKSLSEVRDLFEQFVQKIRSYNAEAPIFIMALTPTNSRWHVWNNTRAANLLLQGLADENENVIFVPTEDLFLGDDGKPKPELFVSDQLHLAPAGYELWTKRLRSYLVPVLN